MWSSTVRTYLPAVPVFGAGVVVSIATGDWEWFARSGSAVVAIAIVLTSHEILEHNRQLRESRLRLEARCSHDWAGDDSIRELVRSRRREESMWETKFHGLYLLVTGTLVWGFGDLLGGLT